MGFVASTARVGRRTSRPVVMRVAKGALSPFDILGVPQTASAGQLKAAFRNAARAWHPDSYWGPDRELASQKFQELTEAYEAAVSMRTRQPVGWNGQAPDAPNWSDLYRSAARTAPTAPTAKPPPSSAPLGDAPDWATRYATTIPQPADRVFATGSPTVGAGSPTVGAGSTVGAGLVLAIVLMRFLAPIVLCVFGAAGALVGFATSGRPVGAICHGFARSIGQSELGQMHGQMIAGGDAAREGTRGVVTPTRVWDTPELADGTEAAWPPLRGQLACGAAGGALLGAVLSSLPIRLAGHTLAEVGLVTIAGMLSARALKVKAQLESARA